MKIYGGAASGEARTSAGKSSDQKSFDNKDVNFNAQALFAVFNFVMV